MRATWFGMDLLASVALHTAVGAGETATRPVRTAPDRPEPAVATEDRRTHEQREELIRRKEEMQERAVNDAQRQLGHGDRRSRRP